MSPNIFFLVLIEHLKKYDHLPLIIDDVVKVLYPNGGSTFRTCPMSIEEPHHHHY